MHVFFFPVHFKTFYSIESIFEVTPNPKQMEDNEEKTESQSVIITFKHTLRNEQFVKLCSWQGIHKTGEVISLLVFTA